MKRRLIVLAGAFSALVLLLVTYWLFVAGGEEMDPKLRRAPPRGGVGEDPDRFGPVEASGGKGLKIYQYDKDRLRAKYTATEWDKAGERFILVRPRVEWYLRGGQLVRIEAEEGWARAEEVGGRVNVREGELRGNVWIVMDRSTDPDRAPLEERPDEAVRIHVPHVRFDYDLLAIESDGYVSLFAREADLLGKGLRIAWSESPRQLRELRIHQGEYLCVREGQEAFVGEGLLPGGPAPAPTTAPRPDRSDDEAGSSGAAGAGRAAVPAGLLLPAALAATGTSADDDPTTAPATAPATAPTTAATTAPATAPARRVLRDTYTAVFSGDVAVTTGSRYVRGADDLALTFEFTPPEEGGFRAERRGFVVPTTSPATAPSTRPATAPSAATRPAGVSPAPAPLVVTWSGPLVLTPLRSDEPRRPGQFDVVGRGARIELADGTSRAVCQRFEVRSPEQEGMLAGSKARPVELTMATGERVTAERVRFDRDRGLVNLDGAGSMSLPAGAAVGREDDGRTGLDVAWTRRVELRLGRGESDDDASAPRGDYLRSAVFAGEVRAVQAGAQSLRADELTVDFREPGGPGARPNQPEALHAAGGVHLRDERSEDFIRADRLDVEMTRTDAGRTVPREATATGTVSARQETTAVEAASVTVTFAAERDEKTDRLRVRPKVLTASGKVKITDDRDPDEVVTAEADELTSDLAARTATLRGKLARLTQTDNAVEGEEIFLDQTGELARVRGRGTLHFLARTDISGTRSEQPRPVDVTWAEGMEYRGKKHTATVTGSVRLVTAGDTMQCEKLRVLFRPPGSGAATRPAPLAGDQAERFRTQRIAQVIAEKDVRLESVRKDPKGFLLRRVLLKSPKQVTYETQARKLNCFGAGTMAVEDYRPPKKPAAGDGGDVLDTGGIARPSQSAFEWKESMQMDQTDRVVILTGSVKLAHRSGKQVLLSEKLTIRPLRKLPDGRKTMMVCDKMLARFAPPEDADAEEPLGGPQVGQLVLFDATGTENDVNMVDGPRQVLCRRVVYHGGEKDTAEIWGSLPAEPVRDAVLYYENKSTGALNSWKSPKLIWHRKTNRIEAKGVEARGGR